MTVTGSSCRAVCRFTAACSLKPDWYYALFDETLKVKYISTNIQAKLSLVVLIPCGIYIVL